MHNADDFQRFRFRIVNDEINFVRLHQPEPKRQRGQITADSTGGGRFGEQIASQVNRFLDLISGVEIISRYITPNID
jgi:hypothetical protein